MSELRCAVPECKEVFYTNELLHPNARFVCKNHPRKVQFTTIGRDYNPATDHPDQATHFQDTQFERELGGPVEHLRNEDGELCGDRRHIPARPKAA
jgi:hypothetical protein